ncbi:hypothetical protein ACFSC6_11080 [Rufibacter sediminis]|uniref:Uncharacterized protein n=1 Tax=Rufibacter sediminis TaxID=2762756 RepID=A0ABR6VTC1_9BACT|nr:hypothetical protein [Rufibacter sediminis]MBC3540424.1 hypothetical protein [Rufibacter sediminis]
MISINNLSYYPVGTTLVSDDLIEFHASRILLILRICGQKDKARKQYKITGLTKLAKLDFFVRYPEFFRRLAKRLDLAELNIENHTGGIESRMIRFHYGPWDQRYYQLLPYLEARSLISVEKDKTAFTFFLLEKGQHITDQLLEDSDFELLKHNLFNIKRSIGSYSGNKLKELVYDMFKEEVTNQPLGNIIF